MSYILGDRPVGQHRPGGGFVFALLGAPRACRDESILVTAIVKSLKLDPDMILVGSLSRASYREGHVVVNLDCFDNGL